MPRLLPIATLVLGAILVGCGNDGNEAATTTVESWDCDAAFERTTYDDEGELVGEIPTLGKTDCAVLFSAGDQALVDLGISTAGCPPEASVIIHFSLVNESFRLDEQATVTADNGPCLDLSDAP